MKRKHQIYALLLSVSVMVEGCHVPKIVSQEVKADLPEEYRGDGTADTTNLANIDWKSYFNDPYLGNIIDTALQHNQELLITMQEIEISANEVSARKGEYLPSVGVKLGAGAEKRSENTPLGAMERQVDIREGKENPEPMPELGVALVANWEVDIWKKLRNATKSAQLHYLSSIEGKNFMVTNLVAEIARSYYELLTLDEQERIIQQNIKLQTPAYDIVKVQKAATRVNELAVKKFEAELLKTQSLQYEVQQKIVETENKLNYLAGGYPRHIERKQTDFATG